MIIVVARDYPSFDQWARFHFPRLTRFKRGRYLIPVTDEAGLIRVMGIERNMPVVYIGGDYGLVEHLRSPLGRECIEMKIAALPLSPAQRAPQDAIRMAEEWLRNYSKTADRDEARWLIVEHLLPALQQAQATHARLAQELSELREGLVDALAMGDGVTRDAQIIETARQMFAEIGASAQLAAPASIPSLQALVAQWRVEADADDARLKRYCFGGELDGDMLDEDIALGFTKNATKRVCADQLAALVSASPQQEG